MEYTNYIVYSGHIIHPLPCFPFISFRPNIGLFSINICVQRKPACLPFFFFFIYIYI